MIWWSTEIRPRSMHSSWAVPVPSVKQVTKESPEPVTANPNWPLPRMHRTAPSPCPTCNSGPASPPPRRTTP